MAAGSRSLGPSAVGPPRSSQARYTAGVDTPNGGNDLESAAIAVEPRLAAWRDRIGELAGVAPILAGSGSTWFVPGERDNALDTLRSEGAAVVVARTAG